MSTPGQRLYDRWADNPWALSLLYAVVFAGREQRFRRRSVAALEADRGDRVLDLGCGPGNSFPLLRETVGQTGEIVGVDYSAGMTRQARTRVRRNGWANVTVLQGDATRLGLPAESVDGVYAGMSVSAMHDPSKALRESNRILKPGGRLAVLDARPFQSPIARPLNAVITPLAKWLTDWRPSVDLVQAMNEEFADVTVSESFGGSLFIAAGRSDPTS